MKDYYTFGFRPEFKSELPDGPKNANSNDIAKWYNSIVPMLNEAMDSDIRIDMSCPSVYRGFEPYTYENRKYTYKEITAKDVTSMKYTKTSKPQFFSDCWQYLHRWEIEKEILRDEYKDIRECIDKVRDLKFYLTSKVSGPADLKLSQPLGWFEFENIAREMKAGKTHRFDYNFTECFGSSDWHGEYDGEHNGHYDIRVVNGHFEFPIKTDPCCWNGHLRCNRGYSKKEVSRLGMAGAGVRTKRYGNLTAKYLNESGIIDIIRKYILKETETKQNVQKLPEVMDPRIYGFDGLTYSIRERSRIKSLCVPEQKDAQRMRKLIDEKKSGDAVCSKITDPYKAARRYISACNILGISPMLNEDKTGFTGPYSIFGNRAIELGCPIDAIAE